MAKLCPECGSDRYSSFYAAGESGPVYDRAHYRRCDHQWVSGSAKQRPPSYFVEAAFLKDCVVETIRGRRIVGPAEKWKEIEAQLESQGVEIRTSVRLWPERGAFFIETDEGDKHLLDEVSS